MRRAASCAVAGLFSSIKRCQAARDTPFRPRFARKHRAFGARGPGSQKRRAPEPSFIFGQDDDE